MSATSEPVGGPAAEARRLVEALGDWASTRLGAAEEQLSTGSAECQVCPVCQLIAALRGDRPEVLARLGDAWAAFLAIISEHPNSTTPSRPPTSPAAPGTEPDASPVPEPPVRPVQNIDVR